jgi:Skp family chaperone for outer membrane proteins
MRGLRLVFAASLLALQPHGLPAQAPGLSLGEPVGAGLPLSGVLVLDFDRLFAQSAYGQRLTAEIEAEGAAIAAENRRIEAELTEEERALTEARDTMAPEEFRALAEAFDEKVQRLRREQDAKARTLGNRGEEARRAFVVLAEPLLQRLMEEAGAQVILERRTVFAARDAVDITDRAIAAINAEIDADEEIRP